MFVIYIYIYIYILLCLHKLRLQPYLIFFLSFFSVGVWDDGNFILELEVGIKNGRNYLGFEDQPDTVTFSEGYQDMISRRGITQNCYESEVWYYNIGCNKV